MEEELEIAIIGGGHPDDIEFIILNNINRENPRIRGVEPFDLMLLSDDAAIKNFRFKQQHITQLRELLRIPVIVRLPSRHRISGISALCVLLRRLAYPNRLYDLENMFRLSEQSLSRIINYMLDHVVQNFGHLLTDLSRHNWLNRERLEIYATAIQVAGGAVLDCWGFIDGTARNICRPILLQEEYYSGHKRNHCVKFQSIIGPDGIISSLMGAYPGRRHDAAIYRASNIYQQLQRVGIFGDRRFLIYGDQGYPVNDLLLCPFGRRANMPQHQIDFNESMKILRASVEWGFQKVIAEFAFVDFKKNQKLLLQDVEAYYKVAVILTNCHSIFYGNQTASFFGVEPPTIQEYLQ